ETSGHTQAVAEVRVDCDGDAVLYVVRQRGPACHTGAPTCFGAPAGGTLARLAGTVAERPRARPAGAYTPPRPAAGGPADGSIGSSRWGWTRWRSPTTATCTARGSSIPRPRPVTSGRSWGSRPISRSAAA